MKLGELLKKADLPTSGSSELTQEISGIAYHSKNVKPGDLFVAIRGLKTDGHQFISKARSLGASAVVEEVDGMDTRMALARLSAAFFDFPSHKLRVIGITGTNGKTSTSYFLESILKESGSLVGLIGTTGARVGISPFPAILTTPESYDLQQILAQMEQLGVDTIVMEVSSHALELHRVAETRFRGGIFTNLTHDHLDFHKDMDAYFSAKKKLFLDGVDWKSSDSFAVINGDDPRGLTILSELRDKPCVRYGMNSGSDVRGEIVRMREEEMEVEIAFPKNKIRCTSKMLGDFNLYNMMAAAASAYALGIDQDVVRTGIQKLRSVPGRFERIDCGQPFRVIVDFAHTPDGLLKLLQTVRRVGKGRVLLAFGCPGERDQTKRPIMGEIASRLADYSVITTDDPHGESPEAIAEQVDEGFGNDRSKRETVLDRRNAIEKIIDMAQPGDWVVLAGRGHETHQDLGGRKIPIDDRQVARDVLVTRFTPSPSI